MNEVENQAITNQIYFERYKNGEANKVIEQLDEACKDMVRYIRKTPDISTKKRYTEIARKLRDVSRKLRDDVEEGTDVDGVIDYELKKQKSILKSIQKDVEKNRGKPVNFLYPSREQIKTSALFKPADSKTGLTYQSYLEGIENGLYNTWDSALRTGYLTGMPTKEIVDYVMGSSAKIGEIKDAGTINTIRNAIYANTRTVLQSFATETMNRVFEENEKYFGDGESDYKYEYLACLDNRTCLPKGEKVLTPSGYVEIENIKIGDVVIGGSREECKVTGVMSKQATELIEIELENGKVIRCTPDHLILTDRGWVEAGELNEKDNIKQKL